MVTCAACAGARPANEGEEELSLVFSGTPEKVLSFQLTQEALKGILAEFADVENKGRPRAVAAVPSVATTPSPARNSALAKVAELTELRLRDPRAFRAQALKRGAVYERSWIKPFLPGCNCFSSRIPLGFL